MAIAFPLLIFAFIGCKKSRPEQSQPPPASKTGLPTAEYKCHFADTQIVLDGQIKEPVWAKADIIENFFILGTDRKAPATTVARLLWNHNYLYIAFECQDDDIAPYATGADGPLWNGDVVELFIKPQEQKPEYFEFEFNPAGTIFDAFYTTGRGEPHEIALLWDSGAKVGYTVNGSANRRDDNDIGYTIEVAIPLSIFNGMITTAPVKGTSWKFAVCRYDYSKNLPAPLLVMSCPNSTHGFHGYELYQTILFME